MAGTSSDTKKKHRFIGLDIGGTGMKGGIVDINPDSETGGQLIGDRFRIDTPKPATPDAMADTAKQIVDELFSRDEAPKSSAPIGICFPSIIHHGIALSANNIDKSWVGVNAHELFADHLGREVRVLNDADAAGLAEARYGAAKDITGSAMVITLGTGIGSAMIHNGVLVPNFELGSLEFNGQMAEKGASAAARERQGLSFKDYAEQMLQPYFEHLERLFSPEIFVIGGGISKKSEKFLPHLKLRAPIVPAKLINNAGIAGAAYFASVAETSM